MPTFDDQSKWIPSDVVTVTDPPYASSAYVPLTGGSTLISYVPRPSCAHVGLSCSMRCTPGPYVTAWVFDARSSAPPKRPHAERRSAEQISAEAREANDMKQTP